MRYGSAQDFMQIPVLRLRPEATAVAPSNPQPGQVWTDTSTSPATVRYWDGTQWVAANGTSIPTGYITDAVINQAANISLAKLATDPLARANHTGSQLASTISDFDTQVRSSRLDQLAAPTQNLDANGVRLVNLAAPVSPGDAVNKSYVDNARAGISVKDPVRVVALGNVNLASPGATIDGVAMDEGDRFLATAQNNGTQNGIYVWHGAAVEATLATDADSAGEIIDGSMVAVAEGNSEGYQYIQTERASGTPGTWTQTWIPFTMGGQTYTAGNGLAISGTTFSLDGPVSIANGGTGAATAVAARASLGATTKFAMDLGALTAGVTYTFTHGLDTLDVGVWFRTTDNNRVIDLEWAPASANTVDVYADVSFGAGSLRAVVVG
jgi:hypothetical protein